MEERSAGRVIGHGLALDLGMILGTFAIMKSLHDFPSMLTLYVNTES
jgi:hypothetical protein